MSFKGPVDSVNVIGGKHTTGGTHQYNQQYGSRPQQNAGGTSQGTAIASLLNAGESALENVQVHAPGASVTSNQGNISQTPNQQTGGRGEKNIGMSIKGPVDSVNVISGKHTIGGTHQYNQQFGSSPQQNEGATSQGPQYSINVDNRKTNIAGKMATHGGKLTTEEHGTSNPMHVKLPGSPE